jgi:hypothetical protein
MVGSIKCVFYRQKIIPTTHFFADRLTLDEDD